MIQIGVSGHIAGYNVFVSGAGDTVTIIKDVRGARAVQVRVPNFGTSISELAKRPGFRLGWGRTADFEVIGLYDTGDGNFGYAINLDDDSMSEWTYCDFGGAS